MHYQKNLYESASGSSTTLIAAQEKMRDVFQTDVYLHEGALSKLETVLDEHVSGSVFFVVDDVAFKSSGASEKINGVLADRHVTYFTEFAPNPKLEDVERGIREFRQSSNEIVIAFGGGTAIDLAKMIGAFASQDASARELATGDVSLRESGPPLIAVPTTAGTGSEATHFAVVYVDGVKHSVAAPFLVPDIAIIDPTLTWSLPSAMTAATGLDAFCQAIESIWAVGANEVSLRCAKQAVAIALAHLPVAVNQPTAKNRLAMCQASHFAGKAINISKTTLPHAASYAITSRYGFPHGFAVAMTLSSTLAFNSRVTDEDCIDKRGAVDVRRRINIILELLDASNVTGGCARIESFLQEVGASATLAKAGIKTAAELDALADEVDLARLSNNPRMPTREDLLKILGGTLQA